MGRIRNWVNNRIVRAISESNGWFWDFGKSAAGVNINQDNVVSISAVYAALNLLASTVATLPLNVYRRTNEGREIARDFSLYEILHDMPNELMTSVDFRRVMMVNYFIGGRAYAIIKWNAKGEVEGLVPVCYWRVHESITPTGRVFKVFFLDGSSRIYNDYEILRLVNIGYSTDKPFAPLDIGRDIFGLAKAAEDFGSRFFSNGANTGGVLKHEKNLSEPAQERLRKQWKDRYQGVENAHEIMVLEEGMEFVKTSYAPDESQFIETRKFQVTEVARFFNVPPHLIMDLERSTYSNIEHQNINFVVYTLRPLLVLWEQEIKRSLLSRQQRLVFYAEYNVDALLRGDSKTRAEVFQIMRQNGVMNADTWREKENMNPIPDGLGKGYYMPLNFAPVEKVAAGNVQSETEAAALNALGALLTRNIGQAVREKPPDTAVLSTAQIRSATKRTKIANEYNGKITDKARALVSHEVKGIRSIAKETLSVETISSKGTAAFTDALESFYDDLPEAIRHQMNTPFSALAKNIYAEAAKEINFTGQWNERVTKFLAQYMDAFTVRHINSSKGQLKSLVKKAADNGQTELEAVEERLDEWEEKRPDKIGLNECVRLAGAIAKAAYSSGGVTRIMWVNMGSQSCPYCNEMDGVVVGIEQNFVSSGGIAEGDGKNMTVYQNTGHPPLHEGCVCTIVST